MLGFISVAEVAWTGVALMIIGVIGIAAEGPRWVTAISTIVLFVGVAMFGYEIYTHALLY